MSDRLDCLVIGYNDLPFSQNEQRVSNRERRDPERRIFMREHLLLEGERLPYMEVVNRILQRTGGTPPDTYLHGGEVPNLAAHYLASYLITRGLSAEPISLFGAERDRIQHLLETRRPRTVAVTTTYYLMPWPVVEINQFIRSHLPETRIVVGGPLVNNLVSDLEPDELMEMFTWMGGDIYVKESQGEETLRSIVEAVRSHTDLSAVPNSYLSTTSGDFEYTRTQQEANVMDECVTDWDLFAESVSVHARTARSCAYKCSFCDYPVRAGALSLTSVEQVESELRQLDRLGVRQVAFMEDTFNVPGPRFKDLCRMMASNDFDFQWCSFFRAAAARDRETYDLMADSGCSTEFHRLAQEVMRYNDRPGLDPDPAVVSALHRVFDQVQAVPGRYRSSASTSPGLVAATDGRG